MSKMRIVGIPLILAIMLVVACAPNTAAPAAPAADAALGAQKTSPVAPAQGLSAAPAKAAWERDWEAVVNGARSEGSLVIYSGNGGEVRAQLPDAFRKFYSNGISVEWVTGRGDALRERLLVEQRAGRYDVDIFLDGITAAVTPRPIFDPLEPALILPEVKDPKAWRNGGLYWMNSAHSYVAFLMWAYPFGIVNTTMVKPGEIKSLQDLLDPKWKGKILTIDPRAGQGRTCMRAIESKLGQDFLRKLATQDLVMVTDTRMNVEWVARGKYPLALSADVFIFQDFQRLGTPIDVLQVKEGAYASSGYGNVAILIRPPHPNAAKLFVNWLLTKEGETLATKVYGVPSLRLDVPTEGLNPAFILQPGVDYFWATGEEFVAKTDDATKTMDDIFFKGK